ncbi:unnamed protein product, partial [Polarella glacialis]
MKPLDGGGSLIERLLLRPRAGVCSPPGVQIPAAQENGVSEGKVENDVKKCEGVLPPTAKPSGAPPSTARQVLPFSRLALRSPPKTSTKALGEVSAAKAPNRSRSPRRGQKALTVSTAGDCFWAVPSELQSWSDPLGEPGTVEFQAALIVPHGADEEMGAIDGGLPVAFYFTGLGSKAGDILSLDWAAVAPRPFVLVVPIRPPKRWWWINDDTHWGWIQGDFEPELVELFCTWMACLVEHPGIDDRRVGLFGFSAGAYAAAELFASGLAPRLCGLGLGGIHGHGQSHLEQVPPSRAAGVLERFQDFLARLRALREGAPWIEATHAATDTQSSWKDAARILEALSLRQAELGLPPVSVRMLSPEQQDSLPSCKRNKTHHDYFKAAFLRREFLEALLGGVRPAIEAAQVVPSSPTGLSVFVPSVRPGSRPVARPSMAPSLVEELLWEAPPPGLRAAAGLLSPGFGRLFVPGAAFAEAKQPSGQPAAMSPSSLRVSEYSVTCKEPGWEDHAFRIFQESGFVIVE